MLVQPTLSVFYLCTTNLDKYYLLSLVLLSLFQKSRVSYDATSISIFTMTCGLIHSHRCYSVFLRQHADCSASTVITLLLNHSWYSLHSVTRNSSKTLVQRNILLLAGKSEHVLHFGRNDLRNSDDKEFCKNSNKFILRCCNFVSNFSSLSSTF